MEPSINVTGLLNAWRAGDQAALDRLMPMLYEELRRTARHYMRLERAGHSFQTNDLVNEAYLRLLGTHQMEYQDRVHFFALAAQMMRRVLVDHARSRGYQKRGGGVKRIPLEESMVMAPGRESEVVQLDDALTELAKQDARKARIVELRFFAGLSVEETATVLQVSTQTVLRDWKLAKAWLLRHMSQADDE
ncbi:sigma-70 family RNA polymerase sigma factor [Paludibaculum fermentans]|uniref:Sigma-70 family RNA polymerase sigma factor n=1 Tax=Paludibaculum fermentans TaxID=1473598 RepID=A0A7S7NPG1_PALFE|nr:sigma-70 family RNA polymerase sigma factor [Paludibaculum fermentans]QOY87315.1 sigma-70 family RNA polymerase sigma factor [Paludibaculum fermentans]